MLPETFAIVGLIPGLSLLPQSMDTPEARAVIVSIGLQESKLSARRQFNGPARSYFQFERAGIAGVLNHPASRDHAVDVLQRLDYGGLVRRPKAVLDVLEHHDALATAFARLLLWTLPAPLPLREESALAFGQYLSLWRPGKPRPDAWPDHFTEAWAIVERLG